MFGSKPANAESSSKTSGQQKSSNFTGGTTPTKAGPANPAERIKPAKERALQIKQAQERALADLPQRKLYIVLWIRSDPPIPNSFHWGFYHHKDTDGGTKYHLRSLGSGWITDHGPTGGVFKSQFLCVLIQIASIPAEEDQRLNQIMSTYDANVNSIPNVTCRVWLFKILELLVQQGLVGCNDLQSLQAECMDYGNQYIADAARNIQPRPVVVSSRCT